MTSIIIDHRKNVSAKVLAETATTLYDKACRALAEAVAVDEVKDIHNQAAAMAEYARRAKNHQLEADAVALRMRAERRLGEMIRAQRETVGLNKGGGDHRVGKKPSAKPTLAEAGIDKNLAHRARKLDALSAEQFEQTVTEAHDAVTSAVGKVVKSITVLKRETAAGEGEIEFTIPQWKAMSVAEQNKYLDPEKFPSPDARLNTEEGDGTDYAQKSYSTIVGCKHPCEILCWAHDVTLRFSDSFPHGFHNPVFRPRMLSAPQNTKVPEEAAVDGRFKNVSSNFMSDMFGAWVPRPWIEATLAVERNDRRWNFLHLTKFPGRLLDFDMPPNCWIGTTVDWQVRIANVEKVFAQLRGKYPDLVLWLSIEPMFERLKFTRLDLFDLIAIGGAARSMRTPEWRPPHRWIMDFIEQVDKQTSGRCKIFEKTNLYGNRILELPGDLPVKEDYSQVAPDVFHYLNPSRRRRATDAGGAA